MDEKKAAQFKRQNDFIRNKYDRIYLTLPKGRKELVQAAAESAGMSVNEFINFAISERLERISS